MKRLFITIALIVIIVLVGFVILIAAFYSEPESPANAIAVPDSFADYPEPERWDAALFLPYSVCEEILKEFKGTVVQTELLGFDSEVRLIDAKIAGAFGNAKITLKLGVGLKGTRKTIECTASGTLRFIEMQRGLDGEVIAKFAASIEDVNFGDERYREFVGKLTAQMVNALFAPILTFALPVPAQLSFRLGFEEEVTFDTDNKGRVNVCVLATDAILSRRVGQIATVFVPSGMWIGVAAEGSGKPTTSPELDGSIEKTLAPYESEGGSVPKLLVHGNLLAGLVNELDHRPDASRISIFGRSHRGNLHYTKWTGGDWGKGGVTVRLKNDKEFGSLMLNPTADWTPRGLTFLCQYTANAQADLAVNVDLGPGGGVGTSVGCHGFSEGTLHGTFTTKLVSKQELQTKEKATALLLTPILGNNQNCTLTAKTDGKLKMKAGADFLSIDVPTFSVIVEANAPSNLLPSLPLLTNEPYPIPFLETNKPSNVRFSLPSEKLKPGELAKIPCLIFEPSDTIHGDEAGYALAFKAKVVRLNKTQITARKDAIKALVKETRQFGRPTIGKISVAVDGIKIGPGNEVVKVFMHIWRNVSQAVNEAKAVGKNIEQTADKAWKDTENQFNRSKKDVKRETRRFGKNVEREVGKFGKTTERKVGGFAKKLERATAKALEKLGEGITNFLRKPFG